MQSRRRQPVVTCLASYILKMSKMAGNIRTVVSASVRPNRLKIQNTIPVTIKTGMNAMRTTKNARHMEV